MASMVPEEDAFDNENPPLTPPRSPYRDNEEEIINGGDSEIHIALHCHHQENEYNEKQNRRKKVICHMLATFILSIFIATIIRRRSISTTTPHKKEEGVVKEDAFYWPFHDSENVEMTTIRNAEYGRVFTFTFDESNIIRNDNNNKNDTENVMSAYSYRTTLGKLRMKIDENEGILCLFRKKAWWLEPFFIHDEKETLPFETILMLGTDNDGSYRLILALLLPDSSFTTTDGTTVTGGFTSCAMHSTSSSEVILTSETGGTIAFYAGYSTNPYELLQDGAIMAAQLASNHPNPLSSPKRRLSRLPTFAQKLGWCTWNAFYTSLSGTKILYGLETLRREGMPDIGWMIIDDGWQHTTNDELFLDLEHIGQRHKLRLADLGTAPAKFSPDDLSSNYDNNRRRSIGDVEGPLLSFKETITQLKRPVETGGQGLDAVFAWHALSGYWMGIEPSSSIPSPSTVETNATIETQLQNPNVTLYHTHFSPGILNNDPDLSTRGGIVGEPSNATDFYGRYHTYMKEIGVDGVKVDVQSLTGYLRPYQPGEKGRHRHEVSTRLHDALSLSIKQSFSNNYRSASSIIHCMCHAPEIIYRIPSLYGQERKYGRSSSIPLPLMRASDDFMPNEISSHSTMITSLSYNSLLVGLLSTPDWDMFQSSPFSPSTNGPSPQAIAKLHAVARSISGGPVYISDIPGQSNVELVKRVVCEDGTVLSCASVALPIREQLLRDPLVEERTLVVWNVNGLPGDGLTWKLSGDDGIDEDGSSTVVTSGVLGLFHLGKGDSGERKEEMIVKVTPQHIEAFQNNVNQQQTSFLSYSHNAQHAWVLNDISDEVEIHIPSGGDTQFWCNVVSIIPVTVIPITSATHQDGGDSPSQKVFDIVPIGLLDKFNGGGAILRVKSSTLATSTSLDKIQNNSVAAAKIDLSVRGCGEFVVLARVRIAGGERPTQWIRSGIEATVTDNEKEVDRVDIIRLWDGERMIDDLPGFNKPISGLEKEGFDMIKFYLPPTTTSGAEKERWVSIKIVLKSN